MRAIEKLIIFEEKKCLTLYLCILLFFRALHTANLKLKDFFNVNISCED